MKIGKTLTGFVLGVSALGLVACNEPTIVQKDLTGDGINDLELEINNGLMYKESRHVVFIRKDDGTFLTTYMKEENGVKYLELDGKAAYVFDGKFYLKIKSDK